MNKNDNIHILFKTLTDTLPYEYTEGLTDNETTIVITKEDSDYDMYISPDGPDTDDFEVIVSYGDEPIEIYQWDANDPNSNLTDLITYIKNSL
nr:MAG: hypothetical protein [Bacteriophage sp.]